MADCLQYASKDRFHHSTHFRVWWCAAFELSCPLTCDTALTWSINLSFDYWLFWLLDHLTGNRQKWQSHEWLRLLKTCHSISRALKVRIIVHTPRWFVRVGAQEIQSSIRDPEMSGCITLILMLSVHFSLNKFKMEWPRLHLGTVSDTQSVVTRESWHLKNVVSGPDLEVCFLLHCRQGVWHTCRHQYAR